MGFLFVVCHIYKKNRFRQMNKNRVYHKKKIVIVFFSCLFFIDRSDRTYGSSYGY